MRFGAAFWLNRMSLVGANTLREPGLTAKLATTVDQPAARAAWEETARSYGIEDRKASDGSDRGLTAGGPPAAVAATLDADRRLGIGEVIFTFRDPFDRETIERIGEVRAALAALPA